MELDPDQLRGQKSGPKQPKIPARTSGGVTTSAPSTRKRKATSSKKSAAPEAAVTPSLPPSEEVEDEEEAVKTPEEPLTRKKRSRTEPVAAPKVTPDVTLQDPGVPGTTLGGAPFSEVARQVLSDAEEIFSEQLPTAPSPPTNMARDPLLCVEDFVVEQADPSPSGTASSPGRATLDGPSTQLSSESRRPVPIVIDDGMI